MHQPIIDVSINNAREVLDASMQKLVLFQFWSARSEGCKQLSPVLELIVQQYPQQLLLARVDCDKEQDLAMQFGVQSLPTVMMIKQGRPVDGFAGVETEQAIRDKLAAYLPKPEDDLLAQAEQLLATQDYAAAYPLLKDALTLAPERTEIKLWLADAAVSLGQLPQGGAHGVGDLTHGHRLLWFDPGAGAAAAVVAAAERLWDRPAAGADSRSC